jgi:O-antigen ligase
MGIPGILVLMLLFFSILREYWRFYKSVDVRLQWLGACGLAMVIGVLMKNMTDHFFSRDLSLLFWSLVGMTLGYGKRLQDRIKT